MKQETEGLRSRIIALIAVAVLSLAGLTGIAAPAQAAQQDFGTKIISASDWLGGNGVDVFSNGSPTTVSNDYSTPAVGMKWQCVELAQRLYKARGWYGGLFPGVDAAYQIYDAAPNMGMSRQANGSITSIVPGDMIIHASSDPWSPRVGHVAIVDSISGSTVSVVEQNLSYSGRNSYTLSNGTLSKGSTPIRGIVHDPDNTSSQGGGSRPWGDFDGNGKADIAWYEPTSASGQTQLSIFGYTGSSFNRSWDNFGWGTPKWSGVGDFTGDGKADIAWYEPTSASGQTQLSIFASTGSGFSRISSSFGWGTPTWAGVGDFNGDGKADVAWYEPTSVSGQSQLSIFAFNGSGFNRISSSFGWGPPKWAGVGDMTGDGKADIGWYEPTSSSGQSQLSIFAFNGSGFNRAWSSFGWGTPTWAGVGDFNGDGKADVAWYEPTSSSGQSQLSVFASTGSGFSRISSSFGWATPKWSGVGDFTGDGKADIAWYEPTSASGQTQLSIFASAGTGFSRISSDFGWATPSWASSRSGSFANTNGSGSK